MDRRYRMYSYGFRYAVDDVSGEYQSLCYKIFGSTSGYFDWHKQLPWYDRNRIHECKFAYSGFNKIKGCSVLYFRSEEEIMLLKLAL